MRRQYKEVNFLSKLTYKFHTVSNKLKAVFLFFIYFLKFIYLLFFIYCGYLVDLLKLNLTILWSTPTCTHDSLLLDFLTLRLVHLFKQFVSYCSACPTPALVPVVGITHQILFPCSSLLSWEQLFVMYCPLL